MGVKVSKKPVPRVVIRMEIEGTSFISEHWLPECLPEEGDPACPRKHSPDAFTIKQKHMVIWILTSLSVGDYSSVIFHQWTPVSLTTVNEGIYLNGRFNLILQIFRTEYKVKYPTHENIVKSFYHSSLCLKWRKKSFAISCCLKQLLVI